MSVIAGIKNYTLTGSFAAVEVPTSLLFTKYIAVTVGGSDFDIRTDTSGSVLYPVSKELGTYPLEVDKRRLHISDSTTLFYVKGSVGANLSIIFWRE